VKNKTIKVTQAQCIKIAQQCNVKKKVALQMFQLLSDIHDAAIAVKKPLKRKNAPKLEQVLNPNSKHFDGTSHFTEEISLVWYRHQQNHKRIRHQRITKSDRQWVHLVEIKNILLKMDGITNSNIMQWAAMLFREAERLAEGYGQPTLYLSLVVSHIYDLIDRVDMTLTNKVTKRQRKIYQIYKQKRAKLTGHKIDKKLIAGSNEHLLVKKVARLIRQYDVTILKYMKVQFDAFAYHESFPAIKDLCSDKATDRIERALLKGTKNIMESKTEAEEQYWRSVKRNARKN
jgi:hypothetical protein